MSRRSSPGPNPPEEVRGFDAFELRLGDVMRGERATLGKSLIDVQRELKIKATYIAAIENADPSAFDTPGFIAGYVRSYARYLGLDPEWAWDTFCREADFRNPHGLSAAASAPKPVKRTGLDALGDPNASFVPRRESAFAQIEFRALGSIFVLVALIGGLGYGAWSMLLEVQRVQQVPVDNVPTVVPELETTGLTAPGASTLTADTFTRLPTEIATVDVADRPFRPAELEVPIIDPRDGPIAAVEPGSLGALASQMPVAAAAFPSDVEIAAQSGTEELEAPQVVADVPPGLFMIAVRPAWVRVKSADGTVLFEKTLEPGENWQVPATEVPPTLRTGSGGNIYFMVEGQTYGPVGQSGEVVDRISLTAANVTESYKSADPGGDPDLAVAVALLQATQ